VRISQYFLQFLLNVRYRAKRLHTISNILFKLFAFKNKYNKNKLSILNKIDNFAIDVQIVTKLIQQTFKKKLNLIDQNTINKTILFSLNFVQISKIFKKRLFETYIKFIK